MPGSSGMDTTVGPDSGIQRLQTRKRIFPVAKALYGLFRNSLTFLLGLALYSKLHMCSRRYPPHRTNDNITDH
jgi:hypothetical protein